MANDRSFPYHRAWVRRRGQTELSRGIRLSRSARTILRYSTLMGAFLMVFGCEDERYLSPDLVQQHMAQYAVMPANKAVYLAKHPDLNFSMYWVSGRASPDDALNAAKAACEGAAAAKKIDLLVCVPMAVNDRQIYDPVPGATAHEQRVLNNQDAAMQQLPGTIQSFGQSLQGLKH